MRSGKELILATKEFATDRQSKSWWMIISTGVIWLIFLSGTLLNIPTIAKIACSIISGFILVRVFVIYHDHQHKSILAKSKIADFFMQLFGLLALTPSSIWKSSHDYHHHHNSILMGASYGSFPVMTKKFYLRLPRKKRFQYLFARHPLTLLFGYITVFMLGMCLLPFLSQPKKHLDGLFSLIVHFSFGSLLLFGLGWQSLVLFLIIPCFISSAIGSYLFYAQHNFPGVLYMDKKGWAYEKAALESSSFFKMNPLMHWFTGNIGYHHIHHLNARIPFYRLPEVMKKFPELQSPKITSFKPSDIYRCLRLKVWDVDKQQMVGLAEI